MPQSSPGFLCSDVFRPLFRPLFRRPSPFLLVLQSSAGRTTRGYSDACGHPYRVKFRFLQTPCGFPCRVCKILERRSMGSRLLAFFFISCGVSLCKIPGGPTRKGILLRNTYFFACARPPVISDDDCSVLLYFFHRC